MSDLCYQSIDQLQKLLAQGEISSTELTEAFLNRIEKIDPKINSFITVTKDLALKMAKEADQRIKRKEKLTPLTGIPLGIKDLFITEGIKTTAGSKFLENFVPPYESTATKKLKEAGVVFLGKLNLDEFAMGTTTETSYFGKTHNPWNLKRIPGGSSGGSAAAVSAGLCAGALGTDTGGSIRQPASHCSIVGIKPTYGRVSRFGVIAYASSLDQVGPMARTVMDSAYLLQIISGKDSCDSTSVNKPVPNYVEILKKSKGLKGVNLGIPKQFVKPVIGKIDSEVLSIFEKGVDKIKELGAKVEEVDLPHCGYAISTYYIIAPAEASSNLARYDGLRYGIRSKNAKTLAETYTKSRAEGFGTEVKRRILLGTYVLSAGYYDAYYLKALKVRHHIANDFKKAFEKYDALISPVTPNLPFPLGEEQSDPVKVYLSDMFTTAVNLAGLPGLSVPCGFSSEGLPVGLQIIGPAFQEEVVLKIAHDFEQGTKFYQKHPNL